MSVPAMRSREVLWRRTFDRVILLVPPSEEPLTLLGTGVDLWEALAVPRTVEDLTTLLGERFGTGAAVIRDDLDRVLADLIDRGVVTRLGG